MVTEVCMDKVVSYVNEFKLSSTFWFSAYAHVSIQYFSLM